MKPLTQYSFRNADDNENKIALSFLTYSIRKELKTFSILSTICGLFILLCVPALSLNDLGRTCFILIFFILGIMCFAYFFSYASKLKKNIIKLESYPIYVLDCIIEKKESNRFYGSDGVDVEVVYLRDITGKKVVFEVDNIYHEHVDYIPMERFFNSYRYTYNEGEHALLVYVPDCNELSTFVITEFMLN